MSRNRSFKLLAVVAVLVVLTLAVGVATALQPEPAVGEAAAQAATEAQPTTVMRAREIPTRQAPAPSDPNANSGALDGCRSAPVNGFCPAWIE